MASATGNLSYSIEWAGIGVSVPDAAEAKKKPTEAIKCDQKFAEVKKICEEGVNTVGKMRHVMKKWRKAAGYADFKCSKRSNMSKFGRSFLPCFSLMG